MKSKNKKLKNPRSVLCLDLGKPLAEYVLGAAKFRRVSRSEFIRECLYAAWRCGRGIK